VKSIGMYGTSDFFRIKEDEEAMRESISRILITLPGERINNPLFGSRVREFLFAFDSVMQEEVKSEINRAVSRWEPRVTISHIDTEIIGENKFNIIVTGVFNDTLEPFTYDQIIRL
jgi:uncharacterized protein